MTESGRYRSPAAFRTAVEARLREVAKKVGRPMAALRRQFLYERFLARVFVDTDSSWVLKGGVGMLVRTPPRARYSEDIDLMHQNADVATAQGELREIGRREAGDFLRFEIARSVTLSVPDALKLKMIAYVGLTTMWDRFDIDVSCENHFVAEPEQHHPTSILPGDFLPALPPFTLYPLVDQIADKVTAMYERHGEVASGRYKDLVDLALLVNLGELSADQLHVALQVRVNKARSPVVLPDRMQSPGPGWKSGYQSEAKRADLPAEAQQLDDALAYVGTCLNPILDKSFTGGRWDPQLRTWL